ncbi:MAG: hypothetical protein UW41_C0019G0004 [Candidatus Collierbacteria bacterium GW2011_GWC2_44_18]|uniref:Uncharacterized protein n=1 Tax=Candidatus Collierbacteria bacterium GW2011_GWC2_44_18 TaxID=1618392 RepID=A0A0G1KLD3_9BACT|nr:MAG: hypothetical protein UW41_C0019G0004 [Candidatus Collierbacteria bacterium GW2011_GWC2_44_18]
MKGTTETKDKEGEKVSDYWEQMILDKGYSGIITVFPNAGELSIGGSKILVRHPEQFETHILHNSGLSPIPSESTFGFLYGILTAAPLKKFPNTNKPDYLDILSVNDLGEVMKRVPAHILDFEDNLRSVCEQMFGVVYESTRDDGSGVPVAHLIILPRTYLQAFSQDCLNTPQFCKDLTDVLLRGVDEELPRQRPNSIMVFCGKKVKQFTL